MREKREATERKTKSKQIKSRVFRFIVSFNAFIGATRKIALNIETRMPFLAIELF
jgi:hypothetical protein